MNTKAITSPAASDLRPLASYQTLLRIGGVVTFALLTGLAAQVRFPIPGTPVPATLQTLVVVLAGVTLGPGLGTIGMALYLLLGAVGYHVFAATGFGWEALAGPTAGYLVGFVLAQPLIGWITGGTRRSWSRLLAALLAGHAVIFATGLIWLGILTQASIGAVLAMGLWPFVPGTVLKVLAAVPLGRAALKTVRPRL